MFNTLETNNKNKKRIGRGGAKGKNAGRGNKGQKSRAGRKIRPIIRDTIQKLPKLRGHNKNRARTVVIFRNPTATVTFNRLEKNFKDGDVVSPKVLRDKKLLRKVKGNLPRVKIVARGDFTRKLVFKNCVMSETATTKIKEVGGKIK